jgi:hypothetical protein
MKNRKFVQIMALLMAGALLLSVVAGALWVVF